MAVVNEGQYKYRDLTVREITNVISQYKDLKPVMDAYVFNDGSSRDLMSLTGTVPVSYRGKTSFPLLTAGKIIMIFIVRS
uniref:UEV domain-containing protein n=1 Tax=Neogobius melanostomus TaxID=47308 RepID=A0A8C6T2E9_9GOBI